MARTTSGLVVLAAVGCTSASDKAPHSMLAESGHTGESAAYSHTAETVDPLSRSVRVPFIHRWTGDEPEDEAGSAVCADDFDGDGRPEVVVGAPSTFVYGTDTVRSHGSVVRLDADAPEGRLEEVALGWMGGWKNGDELGNALACPGDISGDGAPDLVVGGELSEDPVSLIGIVAEPLLGARTLGESLTLRVTNTRGVDAAEDPFACGDVTSDGLADLCVATSELPFYGGSDAYNKGYVFRAPVGSGDLDVAAADTVMRGSAARTHGAGAVGGSDLDGDGAPEVVLGASEIDDNDGGVYVVSVTPPGEIRVVDAPFWRGEPGVGGNTGTGLAVGGDLSGDGENDLFVGAHMADGRSGRGYVVTSPTAGGELADATVRFLATQERDWLGWTASIGDFDGDGRADLALAIPRDIYFGLDQPGRVALFLGPLKGGVLTEGDADLVFRGSDGPDAFGWVMDAVDIDLDGDQELLVGAPHDGRPASSRGAVYLLDPSSWPELRPR